MAVQHTYTSVGVPSMDAAPGSHCTDDAGNQYIMGLSGLASDWMQLADAANSTLYLTTVSTPPEPAPQRGAICTSTTGGPYRVWVTHNPGGETWAWLELALAAV